MKSIRELRSLFEQLRFGENNERKVQVLSEWKKAVGKEYQEIHDQYNMLMTKSQKILGELGLLSIGTNLFQQDCVIESITIKERSTPTEIEGGMQPTFDVQLAFKKISEGDATKGDA